MAAREIQDEFDENQDPIEAKTEKEEEEKKDDDEDEEKTGP